MSVILTIIGALLLIQTVILVHELGHFVAAKAVGIPVAEFCVGAGPVLLRHTWRETTYTLRLLPIIGYVVSKEPEAGFHTYPLWKRVIYIASGPLANLLALVVLGVWIIPEFLVAFGRAGSITWWALPLRSAQLAAQMTWQTAVGLFAAVAGTGSATLGGPVAIYQSSQQAIAGGYMPIMLWLYGMNLSLALFNLLPIPPLDGGRLALCGVEAVLRRPLPRRVELAILQVGAAAFLAFVGYVTIQDLVR